MGEQKSAAGRVKFGRTDDQQEINRIEERPTVFESPVAT
jgi:hypothetical protein